MLTHQLLLGVALATVFNSFLMAVEPPSEQYVTAGFHRRDAQHPAGGTQAWCIGEDGLLNPLENRTELADSANYPTTLLDEESLGTGTFGTATYRCGPRVKAEIEELTTEFLFDARGSVGMRLIAPIGYEGNQDLGLLNRTNFRFIATGVPVDRLSGEADLAFTHNRGNANAGGHIVVGLTGPYIIVTVADNPGDASATGNIGSPPPVPASNETVYLDGQTAAVTVTIEPAFWEERLTSVVWDRVRTEPPGQEINNPAGAALQVVGTAGDLLSATIPNVRWAGYGDNCNTRIDWTIDGTFSFGDIVTFAGGGGHITAAVRLGGTYIQGGATRAGSGPAGVPVVQTVPDPGGVRITGITEGSLEYVKQSSVSLLAVLPNSQFFDLVEAHENRHVVQFLQGKGPWAPLPDWDVIIQNAFDDLTDPNDPKDVYPDEAGAEAAATNFVHSWAIQQNFGITQSGRCWMERDADAYAETVTGKQSVWDTSCRYPQCGGNFDCDGCGPPNGTN